MCYPKTVEPRLIVLPFFHMFAMREIALIRPFHEPDTSE